ncbi:GNAT family N-acetyltransferase [candidate division GN15 bacterium]|nr:GNAT family N-acetyltransferase [candidate division GN15 bacterium]
MTPTNLTIQHLYRTPEHIRMVAEWIYSEFWTDKPEMTPEILEGYLRNAVNDTAIPQSLLAFRDGKPVGTVNLIENDDDQRTHLRPWLAALLVLPEYRNGGIGAELVKECVACAKRVGETQLFLGTHIPAYYEALGWRIHEQVHDTHWVMVFDLIAE